MKPKGGERTFWHARYRPNVVLLHYGELQADLAGEMRNLANALKIDDLADLWPQLVEGATFEQMRSRADEIVPDSTHRIWQDNQRFFNRGTSQWSRLLDDDDDLRRYWARASELADPDLLAWASSPVVHGQQRSVIMDLGALSAMQPQVDRLT
ncbi:MAG: sulfotransferase domain-containing protein [Actinomycetota bacterium]